MTGVYRYHGDFPGVCIGWRILWLRRIPIELFAFSQRRGIALVRSPNVLQGRALIPKSSEESRVDPAYQDTRPALGGLDVLSQPHYGVQPRYGVLHAQAASTTTAKRQSRMGR